MWFIGKHQLPCIIDARQLVSSTPRQGGQPGGKEVMEDALWPGSRNIRALTWPTFAARRNWQLDRSTARQVGQPGGKGSHGRCAVARFSKHPRPDLIKTCGPAELAVRQLGRLGSPAAKEVIEDALWPGSRNIRALTWPTFAARRNCSSTARQVGQPGGKKVMEDAAASHVKASLP